MRFFIMLFLSIQIYASATTEHSYSSNMGEYADSGITSPPIEFKLVQSGNTVTCGSISSGKTQFMTGLLGQSFTKTIEISPPDDSQCIGISSAPLVDGNSVSVIETPYQSWLTRARAVREGGHPYPYIELDALQPAFNGISVRSPQVSATGSNVIVAGIQRTTHQLVLQGGSVDRIADQPTIKFDTPKASASSDLNMSYNGLYIAASYVDTNNKATVVLLRSHHSGNNFSFNDYTTFTLDVTATAPSIYTYPSGHILATVLTNPGELKAYDISSDGSVSPTTIANVVSDYYFRATDFVGALAYQKGFDLFYASYDPPTGKWVTPTLPYIINATKSITSARQSGTFYIGGRNSTGQHEMYYVTGNNLPALAYKSSLQTSTIYPFMWANQIDSGTAINKKAFGYVSLDGSTFVTGVSSSYDPTAVLQDINNRFNRVK